MNSEPVKMLIRVPADVKAWLVAKSRENCSPQSSEIIRSIRQRMDSEPARAAG